MVRAEKRCAPYINNTGKKWIFIHIPKTGGMTVARVLGIQGGHAKLHEISKFVDNVDDYFVFAFTRNPFHRVLSFYYRTLSHKRDVPWINKIKAYLNFDHFVSELLTGEIDQIDPLKEPWTWHMHDQVSWVTLDGRIAVDYIGDTAELMSGVEHICQQIDMPIPDPMPHCNKAPGYLKAMSAKSADIIANRFMRDFVTFGYSDDPSRAGVIVRA